MKYNGPSGSADPNAPYVTGNAVAKIKGSPVPREAVEFPQREIVNALIAAGIVPDNGDLTQLTQAIVALALGVRPGIATALVNGISHPDGVTIKIDSAGKLSVVATSKYEVGEFYYFRHPNLKSGMQPAQGGLITNAATQYPQIWAYLQTTDGQLLCKTEAQWQAMTTATWATLADGTTVGWGGIGGAPFYVQDLAAGTLRMPDLRGMYAEAAGFDSLGVASVHGDVIRDIVGTAAQSSGTYAYGLVYSNSPVVTGAMYVAGAAGGRPFGDNTQAGSALGIKASRVVPTGNANKPRAWGALACAYLGQPAS